MAWDDEYNMIPGLLKQFFAQQQQQQQQQVPTGLLNAAPPVATQALPQAAPAQPTPAEPTQQRGFLSRLFGGDDQTSVTQSPTVQGQSQDLLGLLSNQSNQKNKWMLPLSLGLMEMGAGMAGPYTPLKDAPPWARAVKGLSSGILAGTTIQKQQADDLYKKIGSMVQLKKLLSEGTIKEIGGKKFIQQPDGKWTQIKDDAGGKGTTAERLASKAGISLEEATRRLAKAGAEGKGDIEGKTQSFEQLAEKSLTEKLGRKPLASEILAEIQKLKVEQGKASREGKDILYVDPYDPNKYVYGPSGAPPPGYEGYIPKELVGKKTPPPPYTPGGALMGSKEWLQTGKLPSGFGVGAQQVVENLAAEAGISREDIGDIRSSYKALTTAQSAIQRQYGLIGSFINATELNLKLSERMSEAVQRYGSPVTNKWALWFRKNVAGEVGESPDKDVAAFDAVVRPTVNEYAKVTSSATGAGGVTSDASRKEISDILSTIFNKGQFKNISAALHEEMNNRNIGYNQKLDEVRGQIKQNGRQIDELFTKNLPVDWQTNPEFQRRVFGRRLNTGGTAPANTPQMVTIQGPNGQTKIITRQQAIDAGLLK